MQTEAEPGMLWKKYLQVKSAALWHAEHGCSRELGLMQRKYMEEGKERAYSRFLFFSNKLYSHLTISTEHSILPSI